MKQIRVLLIEDHFLARVALQSVLADHAQIRIIGEAADGEQNFHVQSFALSPTRTAKARRKPLGLADLCALLSTPCPGER